MLAALMASVRVLGMKRAAATPATPPKFTVLQVLPALGDGGVEQSAVEMALYIEKHGGRAVVASSGGAKVKILEENGIAHVRLPLAAKAPWRLLANAWRLAKVIRQYDVSLIHARSRAPAWSAWLASRFTEIPFITTFHGTYGLGGGFLKRKYNSIMVRGPITIANSAFIKAHIIENYDVLAKNVIVATRGVDVERFDPALFDKNDRKTLRDELGVDAKTPLLILVGRLTRWKGQDLLLKALAELQNVPWVLALVGGPEKNGAFAAEIDRLSADLGLKDRVRLLGSRKDVPRLLNAADLALSTSVRPEAFGRVAIEAMAMEVPVVATGLGGSLETIVPGETGWLVAPDANGVIEPQLLAQTIGEALRKPERLARMGKTARAHVLAHFTAEQCCAAEMSAYQRVMKMSGQE